MATAWGDRGVAFASKLVRIHVSGEILSKKTEIRQHLLMDFEMSKTMTTHRLLRHREVELAPAFSPL